jgi:hypothetical protein
MEIVTGIGGLFFRAKDPAALARWYEERLGVTLKAVKLRGIAVATGGGSDGV